MKTKGQQFEDLIWKAWGQSEDYHQTRHRLIKIRDTMSEFQPSFAKMSAQRQYKYAQTILIIVLNSTTKSLRQFSMRLDRNEVFEYAIDEGYAPPVEIEIPPQKLLA